MGILDEELLLQLAQTANNDKRVQWEEIDNILTEVGITEGDFFTHTFAIMYMCIEYSRKNNIPKLDYHTLRKAIKVRFTIRGSGYTKTGSREASELWRQNEKALRKFLKEYKKNPRLKLLELVRSTQD